MIYGPIIVTTISPLKSHRDMAACIIGENNFIEVYIDTPLSICEKRDPKGLYKKVRSGKIKNFTGISSGYEMPINPDLHLNGESPIEENIKKIIELL